MQRKIVWFVIFLSIFILFQGSVSGVLDKATIVAKYYELAVYTDEYGLSFFPDYPPLIGKETVLRLRTFKPALKVTLVSDRDEKIPMTYSEKHWWGRFLIPEDYKEGSHFFTVYIRYPATPKQMGWYGSVLGRLGFKNKYADTCLSESVVWYKAFLQKVETVEATKEAAAPLPEITFEAEEEIPPPVTGEAVEIKVPSLEGVPLLIKGSQTITFKTRILEGSKEGYTAGTQQTREETLRINISGKAADTDIEANLYRTTATGVAQVGQREDKISILLKRGSVEAYLGDFTADLTETEFTKLDKVLSGGRVKADYGRWGLTALYSSPKGESKLFRSYGDGTQGPYRLGYSPAVIDSERVYVDGILQKRGTDYSIDYQAGAVTFLKKTIDRRSVIQIYYDYSQTIYQHATYGLRAFVKPIPNLKIGASYLDDSDRLSGIESVTAEAAAPQSHFVVGADGSFVSENFSADSEIAYSLRKLDLRSASSTIEAGRAGKINLSLSLGPFGISGQAKKIGSQFRPLSDPDPKQDLFEYGGSLSFRPGSLFGSRGDYAYQKYRQSGVVYENILRTAKAQLVPDKLPSLEYNFSEIDESNDPVTGGEFKRVITRNSAETIYQFGFLSSSLKGAVEKWIRRSPSEEVTDYRKVNLGLATIGLEKVTLSSNIELENRKEPTGLEPYRRTYNLNLSANPGKQYFISSSLNVVDDSAQGRTDVVDLAYRAEPLEILKTDGKYTVTSVAEEFPTTSEAVSKQTGSFSFDFRPLQALRLRYLYKPNFTRIERTQSLSYNNEQQQAEINLIPVKQALVGLIYKLGKSFNVYKSDYPNYNVKQNTEDTDSTLYTLKMAPFQILSAEFNYLLDHSLSTTLASTQEPYVYTRGTGKGNKFDVIAKTSLSESFSIDSRYTYQKTDQGTGEITSNVADTKSHTASLKGIWNLSDRWTFSLSGAYSRAADNLLSQLTYTYTPGFGLIYRLEEKLRVDLDYTYSRSYAGASTEKTNFSLRTKYALSNYVDVTLRADQEVSRSPDYRLTDITGNVEISL